MSFNRVLTRQCASAIIFSASLFLATCAAPPKEVTPGQSSPQSQSTASTASTPTSLATGAVSSTSSSAPSRQGDSSGGVKWTTPSRWKAGPERPMRAATYLIPAAQGDSEGAECAVFLNIGGGVDANIKRWIGQFEQPDGSSSEAKARQKNETISGFPVTTVDLTGTFSGGMAMGQAATKKPGYRLLGAIVKTPQGEVFFKLTGPLKTVADAEADFQSLLKSIKQ
ncbi:MAG: hypothetical protein L0226_02265 [Acidobacteria bacterium]|nr:hypothetical protein [Acidobacteriota bacterium]